MFGEGPSDAPVVFVGEQPGDQEDLAGRPFVGPAGQMFDRALAEAGIDRSRVYVTNAVKHFKYEPRGKRRIHKTPNNAEIDHCRWWVDSELNLIKPQLTVALGATAARSLSGRSVTISRERGRVLSFSEGRAGSHHGTSVVSAAAARPGGAGGGIPALRRRPRLSPDCVGRGLARPTIRRGAALEPIGTADGRAACRNVASANCRPAASV